MGLCRIVLALLFFCPFGIHAETFSITDLGGRGVVVSPNKRLFFRLNAADPKQGTIMTMNGKVLRKIALPDDFEISAIDDRGVLLGIIEDSDFEHLFIWNGSALTPIPTVCSQDATSNRIQELAFGSNGHAIFLERCSYYVDDEWNPTLQVVFAEGGTVTAIYDVGTPYINDAFLSVNRIGRATISIELSWNNGNPNILNFIFDKASGLSPITALDPKARIYSIDDQNRLVLASGREVELDGSESHRPLKLNRAMRLLVRSLKIPVAKKRFFSPGTPMQAQQNLASARSDLIDIDTLLCTIPNHYHIEYLYDLEILRNGFILSNEILLNPNGTVPPPGGYCPVLSIDLPEACTKTVTEESVARCHTRVTLTNGAGEPLGRKDLLLHADGEPAQLQLDSDGVRYIDPLLTMEPEGVILCGWDYFHSFHVEGPMYDYWYRRAAAGAAPETEEHCI